MRESVFKTLDSYQGKPLEEYVKIFHLIKDEYCYGVKTIFDIFESCLSSSKSLRSHYIDFESCLEANLPEITDVIRANAPYDGSFAYEGDKQKVLNDFLTFCELLAHMKAVAEEAYVKEIIHNKAFDDRLWDQFSDMMNFSLKSMGYELQEIEEEKHEFEAIKINPEAETVAAKSPKGIRKLVYEYLGTRDKDEKTKERVLLDLINELGPALKSYNKNDENVAKRVKKVGEYLQLMRHPAENREKEKNSWFYGNKEHYLDDLFNLCIFVQNYELTKKTIEKFQFLETEATKENQSL